MQQKLGEGWQEMQGRAGVAPSQSRPWYCKAEKDDERVELAGGFLLGERSCLAVLYLSYGKLTGKPRF